MKRSRFIFRSSGLLCLICLLGVTSLHAGLFSKKKPDEKAVPAAPSPVAAVVTSLPPVVIEAPITSPPPVVKPVIAWDAQMKESQPKPGDAAAKFFFVFTNVSPVDAVITVVRPSCGCTTAQLPPLPWTNAPGATGRIDLSVNLAGKSGTLFKTVTVESDAGTTALQLKIVMPDLAALREKNMQQAAKDRQAVFKGDCAACHVAPGIGKMGKDLYTAVCGVCHESEHRASMVADLHHLPHPTSFDHWQTWITAGKPDSLMPAFAQSQGGSLTPEQIASLADYLVGAITANEGANSAPIVPQPVH